MLLGPAQDIRLEHTEIADAPERPLDRLEPVARRGIGTRAAWSAPSVSRTLPSRSASPACARRRSIRSHACWNHVDPGSHLLPQAGHTSSYSARNRLTRRLAHRAVERFSIFSSRRRACRAISSAIARSAGDSDDSLCSSRFTFIRASPTGPRTRRSSLIERAARRRGRRGRNVRQRSNVASSWRSATRTSCAAAGSLRWRRRRAACTNRMSSCSRSDAMRTGRLSLSIPFMGGQVPRGGLCAPPAAAGRRRRTARRRCRRPGAWRRWS